MAEQVEVQNGKTNSFDNLYYMEQEVMLFCSHHSSRTPKATVHDFMSNVEKFSSNLLAKFNPPLHVQCRWLTAIANQPWLIPENSASAEVQVNALLQYMSSPSEWVRSLACSLLRVFCTELNPHGEHVVTQVTISCKNLVTTLEHSLISGTQSLTGLCQVVACSSLCFIMTYWMSAIPKSSATFVLLTIKSLLNILEKPKPDVTPFLYQVAADGFSQVLHSPPLWLEIMTERDRQDTLSRHMVILQYFASSNSKDNITLIKLLQATNMDGLLRTVMLSPNVVRILLGILLHLLPVVSPSENVSFLEVRWLALCILWRFLHLVGISTADNTAVLAMMDKGCSNINQVTQLNELVSIKFKEYLSLNGSRLLLET